ncbi:MAG: hypothetical protein KDA30_08590, partial [Phycisphaerales bacterium]|nr:hypothetical protein [Phycisphaerales bacterium]
GPRGVWLVGLLKSGGAKGGSGRGGAGGAGGGGGGGGGESDLGGNFTEKQWALGSVRLFRGDPLGQV